MINISDYAYQCTIINNTIEYNNLLFAMVFSLTILVMVDSLLFIHTPNDTTNKAVSILQRIYKRLTSQREVLQEMREKS